ncbi:SMC-Scp complex subunit ScpB [Chryseomicrobium sp. FSL W7-1435]|uniref:SMC-Scp complex subunit ScpB n=1 Tax=Chryseomicrobium sp. FSL W7-1435 TaxID=2921704 RepID=UPI00315B10FA
MKWNLNLISQLESLLFIAGDEGISFSKLCTFTQASSTDLKEHLDHMQRAYKEDASRGIEVVVLANHYQFVTKRENAEVIERMIETTQATALSQAAMEVLAIVAYKQPITRVEIDEIRGVKSDSAVHTLVARVLLKEVGRAEGTGRAILYGTTPEFMQVFGLSSLEDLPPLPEHESEEDDTDLFMSKFQEQFELETSEKG